MFENCKELRYLQTFFLELFCKVKRQVDVEGESGRVFLEDRLEGLEDLQLEEPDRRKESSRSQEQETRGTRGRSRGSRDRGRGCR